MKYLETDILLSELNKLLQELKKISFEKQEIESKLLLSETERMNEMFYKLVQNKSDDMGSYLSEIYSELAKNVSKDLTNYSERMKILNLEKQNLLDENR